jgi:hypothetical protein
MAHQIGKELMHPFRCLNRVRDGERKNSLFSSKQEEKKNETFGKLVVLNAIKEYNGPKNSDREKARNKIY